VDTNYNVPFGSTDFTADALAIKQSGADMVLAPMVQASDIALNTALKQAGADIKVPLFYTGYDQNTLNDQAALTGFEGAYVVGTFPFYDGSNPAATAEIDNLHAAGYKGDIPTFGSNGGYEAAMAIACGLQAGGADPTQASIIANTRKVTAFDGNGTFLEKTDFSEQFEGKGSFDGGSKCQNFVQVQSGKFVLDTKTPVCGETIPGTDTA
jgi:ABC-type branched-subunit amino acid transport system substrate-binding protein